MSLHFIFGRAGTGKTTRVCRDIRDYVTGAPGRKAYLLVPDQGTYTAEYALAAAFPGGGFTDVTVCGFSRLAYRVFQELHSPVADALSPLGQQIIIRRLLEEHKKELTMVYRAAAYPHFSGELTAFFHQLDMFCVSEEAFAAAGEAEGDTPLGRRMADLSLLYNAYHQYLKDHFSYEGSLFDLLAREIPKSAAIRKSRVWIDGFNGMAPQKINIVSALLTTAEEVTVTLQMDAPAEAADNPNFARPYHLYTLLAGREKQFASVTLTENHRFRSPALADMADRFFAKRSLPASQDAVAEGPAAGLHIVSAPRREEETDFITRRILSLVRDQGLRFRDILVISRSPEQYEEIFERTFARYHIPGFIDKKHAMNNHPLVMMLDFLVQFLTKEAKRTGSGWQMTTLFRILKTGLLPDFSIEETDTLENYALAHHIHPGEWHKPWHFRTYYDLDKDPPPMGETELTELRQVNGWRERLVHLLDPVAAAWKEAHTAADYCTILYRWLVQEEVPQQLSRRDEEVEQESGLHPHLQVWKKVLSLLDEIVHASGADTLTPEEFQSILEDGLAALTYSTIPPSLDHVTVTGMDRGYAMEARVVFLCGALEGEFPKRVEESGFFSEMDRQKIFQESGLLFGADLMERVHEETFYAYLALTRARDALYISYPETSGDGKATEPSFLVTQLKHLSYPTALEEGHPARLAGKDRSFFANPAEALSLLPQVLEEGLPETDSPWSALSAWAIAHGQKVALAANLAGLSYRNEAAPLPRGLAAALFSPGGRFVGSVTRLENYRSCPYQYFLKYGMKLEERDDGAMQLLDFGNYLHAGLHLFGSALKKELKQWRNATDKDISETSASIAGKLADRLKYGALRSDGASRYTKRVLDRTFRRTLSLLRQVSQQSRFNTKALEQNFLLHLPTDTGSLTLNGKIDRIDQEGHHVAVIDYKTGRTTASLGEIVSGLKLQLVTYLLAIQEEDKEEDLLPAALLYLYLSGDVKQVDTVPPGGIPQLSLKENTAGYVINDPDILKALDREAGTDQSVLHVKFNKNGSLSKLSSGVLSAEQFQALLSIVKEQIAGLYASMESGAIPIRPARFKNKSPCSYCPYKAICRFDSREPGETYDYVTPPPDKEIREKLSERGEEAAKQSKQ